LFVRKFGERKEVISTEVQSALGGEGGAPFNKGRSSKTF